MIDEYIQPALSLLQGIALVVLAPGLLGLLNYCAAALQGRYRLPTTILQPYRDLARLYRQRSVRAQTGSWLFAVTPIVCFAAYGLLLFAAPVLLHEPLLHLDLISVVYVMALARFTFSLAGLDTGSAFGSLGSSREMFLHLHTEVGMAFFLAGLAISPVTLDLVALADTQHSSSTPWLSGPNMLLLAAAFAVIVLYEAGRVPIDNPASHLELTMAHEGIAGEYAGRDLALIRWSEAMRLTFLIVLGVNLFPLLTLHESKSLSNVVPALVQVAQIVALVAVLALWEATRPKLRLRKVSGPVLMSALFSLMAILYSLTTGGGGK